MHTNVHAKSATPLSFILPIPNLNIHYRSYSVIKYSSSFAACGVEKIIARRNSFTPTHCNAS